MVTTRRMAKKQREEASAGPSLLLALPNELLRMVIAAVALNERPRTLHEFVFLPPKERHKRNKILGFLRLSEVCRRFRELLLSMPTLWANIAFSLPVEMGKVALARSQDAPLPVEIRQSYERHGTIWVPNSPDVIREQHLALACEHAARLSSFSIYDLEAALYYRLFQDPLLFLQKLKLSYRATHPPPNFENVCVNAPNLRQLSLDLMPITSSSFIHGLNHGISFVFPNLIRLELSIHGPHPPGELRPSWVAGILENSPLITHLSLAVSGSAKRMNWDAEFSDHSVQLSHLQFLDMRGPASSNIPSLFKQLHSIRPARCMLTLASVKSSEELVEFVSTFSFLLHGALYDGLLLRVDQEFDTTQILQICAFPSFANPRDCHSSKIKDLPSVTQLYMRSDLPFNSTTYPQTVDVLTDNIRQNTVKQLFIEGATLDKWPSAVDSITSVCREATELVFAHSLYADDEPSFPLSSSADFLPALDTMYLRPTPYDPADESYYPYWIACVAWFYGRKKDGVRVRRLYLLESFPLPNDDDEGSDSDYYSDRDEDKGSDSDSDSGDESMLNARRKEIVASVRGPASDQVTEFVDERVDIF